MKKLKILALSLGLLSSQTWAFVLVHPAFELKNPRKTKIKVSSEGCSAVGISDGTVGSAIKEAIEYWNDVPETRLKLSYGGKSGTSVTSASIPPDEMIVGCGNMATPQALGEAQHDYENRSVRIVMSNTLYSGSNYNKNSFVGTLIHEMGHGLGLAHSDDSASVMTYNENGWGDRPKYIAQDDIEGVIYLYPNEKAAGGFLGSCTSFADDGSSGMTFPTEILLGILFVFTVMTIYRRLRSKKTSV